MDKSCVSVGKFLKFMLRSPTRRSVVNYSHIIGRAARLMKKPSVIDSPSGRVPEKASRWDRGRTEACGGRKVFSSGSQLVLEYLGIYSVRIRSRGAMRGPQAWGRALPPWARPPGLTPPRGSSGLLPKLQGSLLVQKNLIQSFFFVWTPFDNDFLKRQKQAENSNWHWALG